MFLLKISLSKEGIVMAEILFNQNVELCGFNIGRSDILYPSGTPQIEDSTEHSIVYSFVNNNMYRNNSLCGIYQSDVLSRDKYNIYRQPIHSNVKTFLATIDGVTDGFWDYNLSKGEKYKYIVETMPSEKTQNINAVSLETPHFVNPNWTYWSICDIEKSLTTTENSGVDVFVPSDIVFMIKGNVNIGSINDNLNIIKYNTLGQYGKVVQNQQKYDSGNVSCLVGDFKAVESFNEFKNIIVINDVYNKEDFNNVFVNKIIDYQITNYDNYYFTFPNYSSKYYECKKGITYQIIDSEMAPEGWNDQFDLCYVKKTDETYVRAEREYVLVDNIINEENVEIGPPDFQLNYSQYYIKTNDQYIQLTEPLKWDKNIYYTLSQPQPDYQQGKYYRQIIDYNLIEADVQTQYKLLNSIDTLNAWRDCVSNGKLKLLKAPNGLKWIVSINDQNSIDINWQSSSYPATINFNWQEVIDKNKISIIKW